MRFLAYLILIIPFIATPSLAEDAALQAIIAKVEKPRPLDFFDEYYPKNVHSLIRDEQHKRKNIASLSDIDVLKISIGAHCTDVLDALKLTRFLSAQNPHRCWGNGERKCEVKKYKKGNPADHLSVSLKGAKVDYNVPCANDGYWEMQVNYQKFIPKGLLGRRPATVSEKSVELKFVSQKVVSLDYFNNGAILDVHQKKHAPINASALRERFEHRYGQPHWEQDNGTRYKWWFKQGPYPINLDAEASSKRMRISLQLEGYHNRLTLGAGTVSYEGGPEYRKALAAYERKIEKIKKMYQQRKNKNSKNYSDIEF